MQMKINRDLCTGRISRSLYVLLVAKIPLPYSKICSSFECEEINGFRELQHHWERKLDAAQVLFSQSLQIYCLVKRFVALSPNLCCSILVLNVTLEINVYKSAHCVFVLKLKASL